LQRAATLVEAGLAAVHAFKIEMGMLTAAWVECGAASRTTIAARQVLFNAHFISAGSAQHCLLVPLGLGPNCKRMVRQGLMTILASVKDAAALHADGDHIENRPVVIATRFLIEIDPANFRSWHTGLDECVLYLMRTPRLLEPRRTFFAIHLQLISARSCTINSDRFQTALNCRKLQNFGEILACNSLSV